MRAAGQPREALADYLRALSYAPNDRAILREIAELHRQLNQPERALQTLQTLADTYPPGEEPGQVLYLMGLAYVALGRYDDGVESLSAAVTRETHCRDALPPWRGPTVGRSSGGSGRRRAAGPRDATAARAKPRLAPTHRDCPAAARNVEEVVAVGSLAVGSAQRSSCAATLSTIHTLAPARRSAIHCPLPTADCLSPLNALALVLAAVWLRGHALENIPGVNGDEAWYGVKAWQMLHDATVDWHTPTGNPLNPLFIGPLALLHALAAAFDWLVALRGIGQRIGGAGDQLALLPLGVRPADGGRFHRDAGHLADQYRLQPLRLGRQPVVGSHVAGALLRLGGRAISASASAGGSRRRSSPWPSPSGSTRPTCLPAPCIVVAAVARWRSGRNDGRHKNRRSEDPSTSSWPTRILCFIACWHWPAGWRPGFARPIGRTDRCRPNRRTARATGRAGTVGRLAACPVLYPRLFTGGTVYRYVAGSRSWFEWPCRPTGRRGTRCGPVLGAAWLRVGRGCCGGRGACDDRRLRLRNRPTLCC